MSTASQSASATKRRLAIRGRRDLAVALESFRGETVWALKDPIALQYFHLRDQEYWIFRQLDGGVSLADLQERFAERFAPQRLALSELQSFLGTLHQAGLVIADAPGQADELLRRAQQHHWQKIRQTLGNPLALRFRGFDPDRFLNALASLSRPLFSPWSQFAGGALVLAAIVLVASRFDVLEARLPDRHAFFSPANLVWIAVTLAVTKILHELGHALTLKRLGGECHEMGVMLLVFTPCLYCNVSDAWMLPGKWQRAAVGAAGIVVELVLAAACTFLWWFSQPGLFNSLCLNVMFVCSASTLLINGNPLLRYDGYYVLADLAETPNLSRQATMALRQLLARVVLGVELPAEEEVSIARRLVLSLYALASIVYRCVILFGVLWFVHKTLQPHRLEVLAEILTLAVAGGFVLTPLWQFVKFVNHPYWRRKVRTRRSIAGGLVVLAAMAGLLAIPFPYRISAPVVVQAVEARRVYAAVPGRLVQGVAEGAVVQPGEVLAQLESTDLQLEIEKLRGQRNQQLLRVENLQRRQVQDNAAAAELPTARELLADLEQRLEQKLTDEKRLTLTAPLAGTVLPPRRHEPQPVAGALPTWSGTPLDPRNRGCAVDTGTLVCLVGDPSRLEALLVVDQSDVEFVTPGQSVKVQLDQAPGTILIGKIVELAEIDLQTTPPELLAGGDIATRKDEQGLARPASTSYQARVTFDAPAQTLLIGESGRAKIAAAPLSLGRRAMRAFGRTFGLDLSQR